MAQLTDRFRQVGYISKPARRSSWHDCLVRLSQGESYRSCADQNVILPEHLEQFHAIAPVLVVEDNDINARLASLQLKELGLQSRVVASGADALAALGQQAFSLILMDCQMPEMDGFQTARTIRELELARGMRTPIVAVTAQSHYADRDLCLEAGMDDFISKPVTLNKLRHVIQRWVHDTNPPQAKPALLQPPGKINDDLCIGLTHLKTQFGDEVGSDLMSDFVKEVEVMLKQLEVDLKERRSADLRKIIHRLTGLCPAFHAVALGSLSQEIHDELKANNWPLVEVLLSRNERNFPSQSQPSLAIKMSWSFRSLLLTMLVAAAAVFLLSPYTQRLFQHKKQVVLWVWERDQDLRSAKKIIQQMDIAVAYYAGTIYLSDGLALFKPCLQALRLPEDIRSYPVFRIENVASATPAPGALAGAAAIITTFLTERKLMAVQVDYDARFNDRPAYIHFLKQLRAKLPPDTFISMTALASWCLDDCWLKDADADEAVAMLFSMGGTTGKTLHILNDKQLDTGTGRTKLAIGVSANEPDITSYLVEHRILQEANRIYIFNNSGSWTADKIERIWNKLR